MWVLAFTRRDVILNMKMKKETEKHDTLTCVPSRVGSSFNNELEIA